MRGDRLTVVLTGLSLAAVLAGVAAGVYAIVRADPTGEKGSGLGTLYKYDLSGAAKTDPALVKYREETHFPTGFKEARAVAVGPGDLVHVAGDDMVYTFDAANAGAPVEIIRTGGEPRCLAVGNRRFAPGVSLRVQDGTLYVGMKDHVEVFRGGGRVASWKSEGPRSVFTSVAVRESASADEGDVFVADAGLRRVLKYDLRGTLVGTIGEKGSKGAPGFIVPSPYFDVAVGDGATLWVADTGRLRMEAWTFGGELKSWWGVAGAGIRNFVPCCNPSNFALLPGGGFVTAEKGIPRVKVYDAKGEFVCVVAGAESFAQATVPDVAVDSKGRVVVLDSVTREIRIFVEKEKAVPDGTRE